MEGKVIPQRKYNVKPSTRQIKALQFLNQGNSMRKSLKLAGYSVAVQNMSTKFLKQRGVQSAMETMAKNFELVGINNDYMAKKFKEWLEAEKKDHSFTEPDAKVPDYDTQLRAGKMYYERLDKIQGPQEGKLKKKMTIEEFVTDDPQE